MFALAETTPNPFYVYSMAAIESRIRLVKSHLSTDFQIYYSLKANSHSKLLEVMRREGLLADVASLGELESAIRAGFTGDQIEFTGPGKTKAELQSAIKLGVEGIIVESIQELEQIEMIAGAAANEVRVHVRVNPRKKVNSAGRELPEVPSQFGLDEEAGEDFGRALSRCRFVKVVGTHTHLQSQILDASSAVKNLEFALEASAQFSKAGGFTPAFVNLGGGLGIPYSTNQLPVDFAAFANAAKSLVKKAKRQTEFASSQFRLEFGRFISGESGMFVTRVLYTKESRGVKYVITDGGFTQSQIACGVGQPVRRNLPVDVYQRTPTTRSENVTIAGPSCYGLDVLAEGINLPELRQGDLVAIRNVGAYGYSFSPTAFLNQRKADEFFI